MKKVVSRHQRHPDVPLGDPDRNAGAPGAEQSHDYTPSTSYIPPQSESEQAPDAGKGARGDRTRSANDRVSAGQHVTTKKAPKVDGGSDPVRNEREAHVLGNRKKAEADFDSARKPATSAWRKKVASHKRVAGNR